MSLYQRAIGPRQEDYARYRVSYTLSRHGYEVTRVYRKVCTLMAINYDDAVKQATKEHRQDTFRWYLEDVCVEKLWR